MMGKKRKMFLVKQDFDYSIRIIKLYDGPLTEEVKIAVAEDFARELFEEFDIMKKNDREEIIGMIIDDMPIDLYPIN